MGRNTLGLLLIGSMGLNLLLLVLLLGRGNNTPAVAEVPAASVTPAGEATAPPRATRPPAVAVATTATAQPTPLPTTTPTALATVAPTAAPTDEPTATPEPTVAPTETATPVPLPSPTIEAPGPDWLRYLNTFRAEAGLPPLLEDLFWSLESEEHSRYMSLTGSLSHRQDAGSPYYTKGGEQAGINGNIAAGNLASLPYEWAVNYWISAPFHAVPMLDPQLATTGFGEYRDASAVEPVTATLDVRRGLRATPSEVRFPVLFPKDGGLTWVLRYSLPEFPDALSTCTGFRQPSGAPIILQLGDGLQTPVVTGTGLYRDGGYLDHCRFDELTYTHPDPYIQKTARLILDQRDAVVIIPREPLLPDATYSVRVDVNGETYTWSFRTAAGPPR